MTGWPDKDPDAVLDYQVDWTDWLADDTILTSTFSVPAGITKDTETNTTQTATVWLSGGIEGALYKITNRITTAAGRTQDRTVELRVRSR